MPLTITKQYEDKEGRLVSVTRQFSSTNIDKMSRTDTYTPEEYIDFLEGKVRQLEDEFRKDGRLKCIFTWNNKE